MARKRCKPIDQGQLRKGARIEKREHRLSISLARRIARDHLCENPRYYKKAR